MKNIIRYTNYDLMRRKCNKCTSKGVDNNILKEQNREINFCCHTANIIEDYNKQGEKWCINCFKEFEVTEIDFMKYNIYTISGVF